MDTVAYLTHFDPKAATEELEALAEQLEARKQQLGAPVGDRGEQGRLAEARGRLDHREAAQPGGGEIARIPLPPCLAVHLAGLATALGVYVAPNA